MKQDYKKAAAYIEAFIRDKTKEFQGGVIGLSGGIDSTVVAHLAVNAVGKQRVVGVCLPYRDQEYQAAARVAEALGMECLVKNIAPAVDANVAVNPELYDTQLQKGNLMARERMITLYAIAGKNKMIVLGTTNKTEFELGYFTKWGDGGVDIEPIADLYKTEVWEIAEYLGVPKDYIEKTPTAGLWQGQTDEQELGIEYRTIDMILRGENGVAKEKVSRVNEIRKATMHKKVMPEYAKLR